MTLVKWTPKNNMLNIFDDVEQMMHQAFGHSLENDSSRLSYSPLMNVSETESDYLVMMDLPGVEKKDVELNLSDGILTVSGERKTSEKGDENNRIWHETTYGAFSRSFELTSEIVEA
jgi:HSP20 family protein